MEKLVAMNNATAVMFFCSASNVGSIRSLCENDYSVELTIHFDFGDPEMFKNIRKIKGACMQETERKLRYHREQMFLTYSVKWRLQ